MAAERREVVSRAGLEPLLLAQREVLRAGAEDGDPLLLAMSPEDVLPRARAGAPSYSTMVAPTARLATSQFHIIQPQVVK